MQEQVQMTRYTCDGCGRDFVVDFEADGPAHGFHGDVSFIDSEGAYGSSWFACRVSCIKPAILVAVERRD